MIQKLAQLLNPQCKDTVFFQTDQNVFSASPLTIITRPWLGRHNVYGIFILPNEHQLSYPILLNVKWAGTYRKEAYMVKVNVDRGYPVQPGYYLLRVHLRTRVALLMMLQGLSYQLRDPMNWTIFYIVVDK